MRVLDVVYQVTVIARELAVTLLCLVATAALLFSMVYGVPEFNPLIEKEEIKTVTVLYNG